MLAKKKILFVDDDTFIWDFWQSILPSVDVICFIRPEDVMAKVHADQFYLNEFDVIVTDFNFGSASRFSGKDFANWLRSFTNLPVIACTHSSCVSLTDFDGFVDKEPASAAEAMGILFGKAQ